MKYSMVLLWCLMVLACSKDGGENTDGYLTKEALLVNHLAVDGCGWHFSVTTGDANGQFAADETSQGNQVEPFIQSLSSQNGLYSIKVEITFKLTQNKRDVQCGWGKKTSMDEIEIKGIKKL